MARFFGTRFVVLAAVVALGGGVATVPISGQVASAASASTGSSVVNAPVFSPALTVVGQVNLATLASSQAAARAAAPQQATTTNGSKVASSTTGFREVDNAVITHTARSTAATPPSPAATGLSTTNVAGEVGFSALGGVQQAATAGGVDLEPPDQGLCAGGGYVMEFINNALAIYDKSGAQLMGAVGSATAFLQPTTAFLSDPRCYYDPPTKRWFYQEFVEAGTTATQFEAVSNTQDPTGTYTVYSWDTTDASTAGCPCFGDYDQFGADANGIYIATDEFSISTPAYNGVIVYAISKALLETAAATGILPPVFAYRLTKDPFGQPYIVAPTSTPPGAKFAPNTEYFVESNSNLASANHLLVYALNNTSQLTGVSSGPPPCTAPKWRLRATRSRPMPPRSQVPARSGTPIRPRPEVSRPTSTPRWSPLTWAVNSTPSLIPARPAVATPSTGSSSSPNCPGRH